MRETWWAAFHSDGYPSIIRNYYFTGYPSERIEEVDIRPLHQEPCEWEKQKWTDIEERSMDSVEAAEYYIGKMNFCPMCGRRLEVQ